MDWFATLSLALGSAWTSGINLYATVTVLGAFQKFGWKLPGGLEILDNWWVIGFACGLYIVEFFADKIPYVDSVWDVIHTFIRIPAGALLAAGVIGASDGEAWSLAAALVGGSITAGTHFFKAGGRAAINTSPEPVSNWTASYTEEAAVLGGLWMAIQNPIVFLLMLLLFLLIAIWILPRLFRFIISIWKRTAAWFLPTSTTTT